MWMIPLIFLVNNRLDLLDSLLEAHLDELQAYLSYTNLSEELPTQDGYCLYFYLRIIEN